MRTTREPGISKTFRLAAAVATLAALILAPVQAFDMTRVMTQQTRLIRYEATEYQRKVAEARARAFVSAHRRAVAAAEASPSRKSSSPSKTAKTAKKSAPSEPPAEPKVAEKPKKLPRYLAVDTVKDKRASQKAKKVVMIWDTQAESFAGNNLYDVENPPAVGATARFETYAAEYIGAGN